MKVKGKKHIKKKLARIKSSKKGFTLIELLVSVTILGIIMAIALPQMSNLQQQNKETKYKKYAETMVSSAKLYADSYAIDMFGNAPSGCKRIPIEKLEEKGLIKDIKASGDTCFLSNTYVDIRKANNYYIYRTSIICKDKNGKTVYEDITTGDCNGPDEDGPTITIEPAPNTGWVKGTGAKATVKVYDESGMLENTAIELSWTKNGVAYGEAITHDFKNKRDYEADETKPLTYTINLPQNETGKFKLTVKPIKVTDTVGNHTTNTVVSGEFKLDNNPPTCGTNNGSTDWTKNNRTITVNCGDAESGCEKNSYSKEYKTGTTVTDKITIKDKVGNSRDCSVNVYVDKEAPNAPTNGSIGAVSGSTASASIITSSSNTTDVNNGSGFKEIRYVIKTTNSTPTASEFTSTSKSYTRACGQINYAWSAAVDNVGNVSAVKSLGSSSDGANKYSDWGKCSAKCDGGTQTRTNTCALVTTSLSQSCNTQGCCSSTTTTWNDYGPCSAKCNGGTQTRTGVKYSTYDGRNCGSDSSSRTCNTQDCCSETEKKNCNSWSWTSCTRECDGGTRYEKRKCDVVSKFDNSIICENDKTFKRNENTACNTQSCFTCDTDGDVLFGTSKGSVAGNYGDWVTAGDWGNWCHANGTVCWASGGYHRICIHSSCDGLNNGNPVTAKWLEANKGCDYADYWCSCL